MKHGSLFSGIGGFELAAEWAGWGNAFHCEWNEFGQKILKYYWPDSESFTDITKTDFKKYANKIDVLTGGFPCQPYSTAGKRLGKEDDRHLWPEMLRAIREIKPRWVVGENVRGLISWNGGLVFDEVQTDLENEGYEVFPYLLPACAVNAPHRRDRIWFIAYSKSNDNRKFKPNSKKWASNKAKRSEIWCESSRLNDEQPTTNTPGFRQVGNDREREEGKQCGEWRQTFDKLNGNGGEKFTPNSERKRHPREEHRKEKSRQHTKKNQASRWQNFPTEPPVCSGDDGFPFQLDGITFPKWRNESIKAYGNAIVPQVAYQIFKAINEYEQHETK
jgi:DNA (cytosine-5)-methyltransferase 1